MINKKKYEDEIKKKNIKNILNIFNMKSNCFNVIQLI
jgi:hypothetical protein